MTFVEGWALTATASELEEAMESLYREIDRRACALDQHRIEFPSEPIIPTMGSIDRLPPCSCGE